MNERRKKKKRAAWAAKKTIELCLPVLTRDDIGNLRTGVIPEREKKWFDFAKL